MEQGQGKNDRFAQAYTDSFGFLRAALTGVTQWTDRQIRATGIVAPHIAKGDIFSYNVQFPHSKKQDGKVADFHLHIVPIGTSAAGQVIAIDYSWGYYKFGEAIPNVLPNSNTATYTFTDDSQYKHLYFEICDNLTGAASDNYSSFFLMKCTRRSDAQDTYASEFALLGADCHFQSDRIGSYNETHD